MKMTNIAKIAGLMAALTILATPQAKASFDFSLGVCNLSGFTGPYADVAVNLADPTHATITFTSRTAEGKIYLLTDGGAVAVNVNATSWTLDLDTVSASNAGTGFTPGPFSNGGTGNEDGFGSFNQTINSFDSFTHSSDTISFVLANTGGTWASAEDVLTANAAGNLAAAHIAITSSPANASNKAINTGYVSQVPEPTTMIAGALLLLPFGASTLRILRRNRRA